MPGCCPQGIEKKILPMAHMEEVSMRKAGIICQMHAEATQCSLPRPSAQLRPTSSTQINNPRPLPRPPVSLSHHIRSRLSRPFRVLTANLKLLPFCVYWLLWTGGNIKRKDANEHVRLPLCLKGILTPDIDRIANCMKAIFESGERRRNKSPSAVRCSVACVAAKLLATAAALYTKYTTIPISAALNTCLALEHGWVCRPRTSKNKNDIERKNLKNRHKCTTKSGLFHPHTESASVDTKECVHLIGCLYLMDSSTLKLVLTGKAFNKWNEVLSITSSPLTCSHISASLYSLIRYRTN